MGYIESRSKDYHAACRDIVDKLKVLGFCAGQVFSINVHNNNPDGDAIVCAHWHAEPVGM